MKKAIIASQVRFDKKVRYFLDLTVSEKNLVSDEEMQKNIKDIFSNYDKIDIFLEIFRITNSNVKIILEINHFEENDFILGCLENFIYLLGNVRILSRKVEYRET